MERTQQSVMNYRESARDVLMSCGKISPDNVTLLEQQAWEHCPKKYPIVIRRLYTGISLTEAVAELEPIEALDQEEIMVDGDITCPKCKGKKVHRIEKQTRSADESATVFCYCSTCGKRWKF